MGIELEMQDRNKFHQTKKYQNYFKYRLHFFIFGCIEWFISEDIYYFMRQTGYFVLFRCLLPN